MKNRRSSISFRTLQHQIKILENLSKSEIDTEKWQEKFITYSEISPISESRFSSINDLNFGNIITEGFYLFKIRYIKDITVNMRISFKNHQFEIKRIINLQQNNKFLNIIGLEIYAS